MSVYLENINGSAYQYQLAVQETFDEICKPLFRLGIKYFYYSTFFKTGEYLNFSNHNEFIKDHYFYLKHLGGVVAEAYSEIFLKDQAKSYFLVPYDKQGTDQMIDFVISKNLWNAFCILKKDSGTEYVKTYAFAMDINDSLFSHFYFKYLYILENFCDYFEENTKGVIDSKDKTKFGFLEFQIDYSKIYNEEILTQKTQQFLQETFIEKRVLKTEEKDIRLSKREVECLNFLSLGKTMKEIARNLDLSPRSVEFYLQNIKKKSGLKRGELITHFAHNFTVGHLTSIR